MSFSNSTFTIEINGVPSAAFEAKWHGEADAISRSWVNVHWAQLSAKGRHGSDMPPVAKVRLARPDEQARYGAGGVAAEFHQGVKLILFVDLGFS